jgi:SAM-dependent methyltransferase
MPPLPLSHLDLARHYWRLLILPGDKVVDATCGNGKDTRTLAELVGPEGSVIALDVQQAAIDRARQYALSCAHPIRFFCQSHETFPEEILPGTVKLIVYNLGYLPGGDKRRTTTSVATLASLEQALPLLCPGGGLSITCYPGHPEGHCEAEAVTAYAASLDPTVWSVCCHRQLNRPLSPFLLFMLSLEERDTFKRCVQRNRELSDRG